MALLMATMAIGSLLSSNSQRNAKMKAQAADAKLQRARLEVARTRTTDAFSTNTSRAIQSSQKRDVAIERSRINAESKIDETFAGSGISGTSVDELDNEIGAAVSNNKYENQSALDRQLSDDTKSFSDSMSDTNAQSKSINTTAPKADVFSDISKAVSAAGSVSGLDKKVSGLFSGGSVSTPTPSLGIAMNTNTNSFNNIG